MISQYSLMSEVERMRARARSKTYYERHKAESGKRAYERHLRLGRIKHPRSETLEKWGISIGTDDHLLADRPRACQGPPCMMVD